MNSTLIFFLILALASVLSALGLLVSRSAVYAALFLVLNFACVAIFYLLLGAPFIALTQITVYAGAIMVLFLFVIMLLGAEKLPRAKAIPWQRPLAIGLAAVLLFEAGFMLIQRVKLTTLLPNPEAQSTAWNPFAPWPWPSSTSISCHLKSLPSCSWWPWWAPSY